VLIKKKKGKFSSLLREAGLIQQMTGERVDKKPPGGKKVPLHGFGRDRGTTGNVKGERGGK